MDFDTVAEELYGVARGNFVTLREERVAQARSGGDRELAERLHRLRKPTKAAALVNRLVRQRPADLDTLFGTARKLRQAHAELAGEELRALTRERTEIVRRLTNQAAELEGGELGQSLESEVTNTFSAAVADPELEHELRRGRLTSTLQAPAQPLFPAGPAPERAEPAPSRGRRSGHAATAREHESAGTRHTKTKPREDQARQRSRDERSPADHRGEGGSGEDRHREDELRESGREKVERRAQERHRKERRREAEIAARRARDEARKELRAAERAEAKARERTEAARRTFEAAEAQLRDANSQ